MQKRRTIELANVVINFGDQGLVENLKDKVFPILSDGNVNGKGEVRSYKFLGVKALQIGDTNTPCLFGRLVKIMTIEAEQEFDENKDKLIQSSKQISSAPSSFFLINLINHRMAFLGETRRSPGLNDFEYSIRRLLNLDWRKNYKNELKNILSGDGLSRIPKGKKDEYEARALKICPFPDVRVTPLPALKEVGKKFDVFNVITSLNIKPMKTNNELPDENAEFLKKYEEQQKRIGSSATSIELSNGKQGLDKNETQKLVKAASNGNYKVKMKGKTRNGSELKSDLEEVSIKLKEEIPSVESDTNRANRLLTKMIEAFAAGYVMVANNTESLFDKAVSIVRELNGDVHE